MSDSRDQVRDIVCRAIGRLAGRHDGPSTGAARVVITARDVEATSGGSLRVPENAIVTPEARDRARDLGVRLRPGAARPAGKLSAEQERLAEQLARQIESELDPGRIGDLAFWCINEGSCATPEGLENLVNAGADRVGVALCAPPLGDAIAPLIDHTLLKPAATAEQIRQLCAEAREFGFASVCVNPTWVELASSELRDSGVRTCTVVGFPLGATFPEAKAAETRMAIDRGASEIDMVLNVGALKSGLDAEVECDIAAVVREAHPDAIVKVILETGLLDEEEIVRACRLSRRAGADFVKTSTGFGPGGATVEHVGLMRRTVGRAMGVKASGGIGSRKDAAQMIAAGATRLGASAGVRIARGD